MNRSQQQSLQVPINLYPHISALSKINKSLFDLVEHLGGKELAEAFEKVNQEKYSKAVKTGKGGDRGGKGRPDGFTSKEDFFKQIGVSVPRSISQHLLKIINEHKKLLLAYHEVAGKRFE